MKPLTEFFSDYVSKSLFHDVYVAAWPAGTKRDGTQVLNRFLDSRLDINRLKAASEFIEDCIFKKPHFEDLDACLEGWTEFIEFV